MLTTKGKAQEAEATKDLRLAVQEFSLDELKEILTDINKELVEALTVLKTFPLERINRLTDKSSTSDIVITYKLNAPRRKGKKSAKNLSGGSLALVRGEWQYTCKVFGNEVDGEKVIDIVANLKHPFHQANIRAKMGRSLNVLMLTPEIMVQCNRKWFPDVWDRPSDRDKLKKGTKLEDNSRLNVPTDELIASYMRPGGTLQGFDSLITRCQNEILDKVILQGKQGTAFSGASIFENPVLPDLIPLPEEKKAFWDKNNIQTKEDSRFIEYCKSERALYLEKIGGKLG